MKIRRSTLPVHLNNGLAFGLRHVAEPALGATGPSSGAAGSGVSGGTELESDIDLVAPEGTGDAGKQAIDRMKNERNAARKELRDAQAKLVAFEAAEQAKADADKSEAERRQAAEERAAKADLRALKVEVAFEKGLTQAQAKRLVGSTREELVADADEILVDFPVTAVKVEPKTPKPDPSQGARQEGVATVDAGRSLYERRHPPKKAS